MVGKTTAALTQIRAVALTCTHSPCIFHHCTPTIKNNKKQYSLKNVLDETVKIILLKFGP